VDSSWLIDCVRRHLPGGAPPEPVGFQNLAMVSHLQRCDRPGSCHVARRYSWIRPPRTLRRRIRTAARSVTGPVTMPPLSGGRRFRARCGRCWL
jgi:hypothetical protein